MRATRLPPMRNTTGPHRARHSVFRHPATMPDKAGVEVYRYARRPVDSLVCIGPIRGTGNASVRSCCALYGYVSGSHAVHPLRRKSGPSCARRSARPHRSAPHARYSALGCRTRSCHLGAPRAPDDSASRKTPSPTCHPPITAMRGARRSSGASVVTPAVPSFDAIGARTRLVASAPIPWRTRMPKSA